MPSALEILVKILKLEREQGYKDKAVTSGLGAYADEWSRQAEIQARKPEHLLLIDEIASVMRRYPAADSKDDRHALITYMLDRITNRAPMPEGYQARLPDAEARWASMPHPISTSPAEKAPNTRPAPAENASSSGEPASERPPKQERGTAQPPREKRDDRERAKPPSADQDSRRDKHRDGDRRREQGRPLVAAPPPAYEDAPIGSAGDTPLAQGDMTDVPSPRITAAESARPPREERQREKDKKDKGGKDRRQERTHPAKPPHDSSSDGSMRSDDDFSSLDDVYASARVPVKMDIPVPPKLARPPRMPRPERPADENADILRGLSAPIDRMKGIGPQKAKSLTKLGIETIGDLLNFLPRRYDDYTRIHYISRLEEKQRVTVIGTVRVAEVRVGKNNRKDFYIAVDDGTAMLGVTFFGQFYLQKQIRLGQQICLYGETTLFNGRIQMTNPEWDYLDVEDLQNVRIVPIYPLTEGLTARVLRRWMDTAVEFWAERIPDYVPESVLERTDLADLGWAIRNLHFPESEDHLRHARRRFIFDQLLLLQLAILGGRRQWQQVAAISMPVEEEDVAVFAGAVFPYPLTNAQTRVIDEIRRDLAKTIPMNRLVQGDVGSGKTAVAISAIAIALMHGKQAALMAPTSILAEQHYRNISRALEQTPLDTLPNGRQPITALLTGSLPTAERERVLAGLADGSIDVVIGTHAIISEGVFFNELALTIIDEQHRFGVEQRGALRGKGTNPHLLVMTATPIPRTLALTVHADLDLSILDEMPPGRIPVKTYIVPPGRRESAYEWIEGELQQGHQAFVVYPLVEASEIITEAKAAVEEYEKLRGVFHRFKVGLLHGKMKPAEKDQVMADFRDHQFDVLVTTSVAEVGVDIPNATVIMMEGANRFGLAQLHQFRGRVGRGGMPSYCLLISDTSEVSAIERLKIVRDNPDGFKLAEEDFRQRGAGDLIGTRQSGQGNLKLQLGEMMTPELVELAQREARTLYEEDPDFKLPEHRLLAQRVEMLKDERTDVS